MLGLGLLEAKLLHSKALPDCKEDVRSDTDVTDKWLLRRLKIA